MTMHGTFVSCNGMLGRITTISISHESHIVMGAASKCALYEHDNFITVPTQILQSQTLAAFLRLTSSKIGPRDSTGEISLLR